MFNCLTNLIQRNLINKLFLKYFSKCKFYYFAHAFLYLTLFNKGNSNKFIMQAFFNLFLKINF